MIQLGKCYHNFESLVGECLLSFHLFLLLSFLLLKSQKCLQLALETYSFTSLRLCNIMEIYKFLQSYRLNIENYPVKYSIVNDSMKILFVKCKELLAQNGNILREALISHYSGGTYAPIAEADQGFQWALLGNTRSGKSTFVNAMTGTESAAVGAGYGQSTTSSSKAYTAELFGGQQLTIIDTVGFNDTQGTNNSDIKKGIFKAIVQGNTKGTIDAVLLFQSCQSDSFGFLELVDKAKEIFGPSIRDSLVVLFTKHLSNPGFAQEGIQICSNKGLKSFLWESIKINKEDMTRQKAALQEFLLNPTPYRVDEAFAFLRGVAERALLNQGAAPSLVNSIIENYTVTEYDIQTVTQYHQVSVPYSYEKRRGGPAGFFGGTKTVTEYVNQSVPYQTKISVPRLVTRTRTIQTETKPPLLQFIGPAKQELLAELV